MVLAIAFGLVLLLGFTAFVLRLAENAIRRGAEAQVRSTAQLSARLVSEQSLRFGEVVNAYALQLATLHKAKQSRLPRADEVRLTAALTALLGNVAGIRAATFTDQHGRLVDRLPPNGQRPGLDLKTRDWYRGVLHRSPYQSKAIIASTDKAQITVVSVAVRDPKSHLIGVLAASESHRAQGFADTYGRRLGASVTVTDQAGQIVGQTGHPPKKLTSLASDPLVQAALNGKHGVNVRTLDGQRTVSGYSVVPGTGWTVIADVPASKAFHDVSRLRITLLLGTGVVALLLLVLVPRLVSRLSSARDALDISEEFQRDLLPATLPAGVQSYYMASERRMLLGGDFLDVVELEDGGLALMIGDVCGHGPRAAALGAIIRAGWRTMATTGAPVEHLALLDQLVESARHDDDLFATIACAVIAPDGRSLRYAVAGHPPPLLIGRDGPSMLDDVRGAALGLGIRAARPVGTRELTPGWSLALYTDGLIEARATGNKPRLGLDGLGQLVVRAMLDGRLDADRLMRLVAAATEDPDDDVAMLLVDSSKMKFAGASPPPAATPVA